MRSRPAFLSAVAAVLGLGLVATAAPAHADWYGGGGGYRHFEGGRGYGGGWREGGYGWRGRGYYGPAIVGGALLGLGVGAVVAAPPPPVYYAPPPRPVYYPPYAYAPPPVYVERRTEYVEVPVPVYPVHHRIVHHVTAHPAPLPCTCH